MSAREALGGPCWRPGCMTPARTALALPGDVALGSCPGHWAQLAAKWRAWSSPEAARERFGAAQAWEHDAPGGGRWRWQGDESRRMVAAFVESLAEAGEAVA